MLKFSEYITEGKNEDNITASIESNTKIHNLAMRTHNSKDLKKAMIKLKDDFKKSVDLDKVDWEEVFIDLNENKG